MIYHNNYENMSLWQILDAFSHYQKVNFAFYCAKNIESFTNDQRIIDCNLAVERWLNGDKIGYLEFARNNAANIWNANAAAYAARIIVHDAAFAASLYVSGVPMYGSHEYYVSSANTSNACDAVYCAATAKSYNFYPNEETKRKIAYKQFLQEYKQIAQNWLSHWNIPNFPKDEPDFPLFDYLQDMNLISCLLPKKENYYYLNLNYFDLKHVDEVELLKEIDTTHIKNILRRIIDNDLS